MYGKYKLLQEIRLSKKQDVWEIQIAEERILSKKQGVRDIQIAARDKSFEETRCMKESVREMLDRLYIIAYLFKMKFRHPVAKASC